VKEKVSGFEFRVSKALRELDTPKREFESGNLKLET
jgi:hypothetical protein